ncbi:chemotaxis protein CheW [Domibacillus epiphyticus]|uniref:CheW-like domain-containing protein n=1 Tax=Domibacillus epiphyticus TaxID=1714355 RepID=A0A1V2A858_9BACI|nr:chemotaxis protein CheW [Domibacillus epiphyticus]OMP67004.1 hypothetical protein BTO28_08395 [Domibacillus epiphyticus]
MNDKFLLFDIKKSMYGMGIQNVVSIEKVTEASPFPNMPEYVVGMVQIRGQIIVVIDMSSLLYNNSSQIDNDTRFILVERNETVIALMVERANEIINIEENEIKPVHSIETGTETFIIGAALEENRIITILDIEKLLTSLQDIDAIRREIAEQNNEYINEK